jgi:superfamily II DNA or RNA helicase
VSGSRPLFLDERRLLGGPWQAFERDVARLLLMKGFEDVRIVGGVGDRGADILGTLRGELWVFQCKYTSTTPPPRSAVQEVVDAGRFYTADRLVVATSRPAGEGLLSEKRRHERMGLTVQLAEPRVLMGMLERAPEYAPSRRALRDYQQEASERLREALLDTGRGQIVLATGLGKTVVMAEVVADMLSDERIQRGRVLVVAHTRDLVDQLQRAFWFQLPKWVATHRLMEGEFPSFWDGITFSTIQSALANLDRLPEFGLIVVDEAHHIGAETFKRVIQAVKPAMLAGVTATPWRGDGYDIDEILGPALVKIGIAEGLRRGFLAELDYHMLGDNLDWKFVQNLSRYSYSISELNRRLIIPTRDEEAARLVRQVFYEQKRRGAIVFSPTIVHSEAFAAMLRHQGLKAESMSSDTEPRRRDLLMSRFRAGQLEAVVTVDLFNEGVDVPDVDLLVFMRATHSRRIFVQQLGRGLRLSPGKDKVTVLDFVTDLRRVAEVVELDRAVRDGEVERLGIGSRLIQFQDRSAGSFLQEWILDQASLFLRESEAELELPKFEFPETRPSGSVQ